MSTPYDDTDVQETAPDVAGIRELNDALRASADPILRLIINGQLVVTHAVAARGDDFFKRAVAAVRTFGDFNADNDPHGEHDMAFLEVDGERIFFKLDYFDPIRAMHSEDPTDPSKTERVLTIMLASEY